MAMGGGRNFGTVLKIFGVAFVRALHKGLVIFVFGCLW